MTALVEQSERVDDSLVTRHQAVVILELESAVTVDEALAVLVGLDVWRELFWQRSSQSFDPFRVRGLARPAVKRVMHRREQERDGID